MSPQLQPQLVEKIKAGDKTSITQWFKIFYPSIYKFVSSRVKTKEDAEDLVQKIFIESLQQISLLRDNRKLYAWMLSIAHARVSDFYRKNYAKKIIHYLPLGDNLLALNNRDIDQVTQDVRDALALMKKTSRELLQLKYLDKRKIAEIAQSQGVTSKTIESQLYRARQEFRLCYLQVTEGN